MAGGKVGERLAHEPCLLRLGGGRTLHDDRINAHARLIPYLQGALASIGQRDLVGRSQGEAPRDAVHSIPHTEGPRPRRDPQDEAGDFLIAVVDSGLASGDPDREYALGVNITVGILNPRRRDGDGGDQQITLPDRPADTLQLEAQAGVPSAAS